MQIRIESGLLEVAEIGSSPERPSIDPPDIIRPPPARTPYFRVGKAEGKAGEIVEVPVFGGCSGAMGGFHFGCGCGGWDNVPQGVMLSKYLADHTYLKTPFELFQYIGAKEGAIPEAFFEYALGLFSIAGENVIQPIPIPPDTELFRVKFKISERAEPGDLVLKCADEYFYTQSNHRRRDYLYTNDRQGYTKIDCFDGRITVT